MKYGLSVPGSLHVHEELNCAFSGFAVAMALKMVASVDPTYITRLDRPGAIPTACVIVEGLFRVLAERIFATRAGAVSRQEGDRNLVGLLNVRVIRVQVGQVGTVILQQSQRLAAARERSAIVGLPSCRCLGRRQTGRIRSSRSGLRRR